jgi:uncharacterized alpha-E superfamily protein
MSQDLPLLARYAESLFWMARYLERVENLARLIDVTQIFESPGREAAAWYALIRINADEDEFAKRAHAADPDTVKRFYLLERDNPSSIPASIDAARMNARTLRPLISTEMWMQLNMFHRDVAAITEDELQGDKLSRLCGMIKLGVQKHTGITEGTFFRDQGWCFYELGRLIERADQTTRLLDIRFHSLVPHGTEERRVEEMTLWAGVLRGAAGYHAFRRVAPPGFTPQDVVRFLLTDASFPRSVLLCVGQMEWLLGLLRSRYGLRGTVAALERIEEVRAAILSRPVERVIAEGLHEFLDGVQRDLILLAGEIGTAFFRDWRPLATEQQPAVAPVMTQTGMTQAGMTQAGMTQNGMTQEMRAQRPG